MEELEVTQPEENQENVEATEAQEGVEDQALEDATHEPGAHIEETQIIEQAEAVEEALTEAMDGEDEDAPPAESGSTSYSPNPGVPEGEGGWLGTGDDEVPPDVQMTEPLRESGPAEETEIPDGIEVKLASEDDGTVDRNDHPMVEDPELTEATSKDDDDEDEATPINLPGPVAETPGSSGGQVADEPTHGPNPIADLADNPDLSPGVDGNLPGEENAPGGPGSGDVAATPINIPKPGGDVSATPINIPKPGGDVSATPINIPKPGGDVAGYDDPGDPPPPPDLSPGVDGNLPEEENAPSGPGGGDVSATPINIPKPGGNVAGHKEPGDPPPPPDLRGDTELSPDDVKIDENLQPAPDFEDMNPSERSVVDIISKAISDEEYRGSLFADARTALAGYTVTDDDQSALGEMTVESFDFFAAEVEKRFGEAMTGVSEGAQQQIMQQVVHAVWRDLNPGSLAYVLAYKIPNKHLT